MVKESELPWCLCDKRWYRFLFLDNPLNMNQYWWLGWFDPESWLEWWHLGVPVRMYYWKRDKWIDFPFTNRRGLKMWRNATPVDLAPPKEEE